MIDFLITPVLSFFSLRLYHRVLKAGVGRGFAYLAYLTALFCLLAIFLCHFILLPIVKDFGQWLIDVTPEMKITSSGLETKMAQPYLVKHPVIGLLYLIDTTRSEAALLDDRSGAPILIGKDHIVFRGTARHETRMYDFKRVIEQVQKTNRPVSITKQLMYQLARRVYGMIIPLILLFLIPAFFLWKLLVVLFYSVVALLLNLFRKEKLRYRSLFVLSCFVITPVTIIQWMNISIPEVHFNVNMLLSFALTTAYLAYGMFVSSRSAG